VSVVAPTDCFSPLPSHRFPARSAKSVAFSVLARRDVHDAPDRGFALNARGKFSFGGSGSIAKKLPISPEVRTTDPLPATRVTHPRAPRMMIQGPCLYRPDFSSFPEGERKSRPALRGPAPPPRPAYGLVARAHLLILLSFAEISFTPKKASFSSRWAERGLARGSACRIDAVFCPGA